MYHSHMNDVMASYVLLQQGPFEGVLTDMQTHPQAHQSQPERQRQPPPRARFWACEARHAAGHVSAGSGLGGVFRRDFAEQSGAQPRWH